MKNIGRTYHGQIGFSKDGKISSRACAESLLVAEGFEPIMSTYKETKPKKSPEGHPVVEYTVQLA